MKPIHTNNDWTMLGDLFIRNAQLYEGLNLPIRESGCLFATCPYGGPIAIALAMQDGPLSSGKSTATVWKVIISSANGQHLFGCIQASTIVSMFWSKCQKLILINSDARVLLYSACGKKLHFFNMGEETQELGMIEAKCFNYAKDTGLAVLNSAHHIYAINSINNRAIWRVHDCERRTEPPTCWTVISSSSKPTSVLICARTKFYLGILESKAEQINFDWALSSGSYLAIEPNHEQQEVALVHDSGLIQVVSSQSHTLLHTIQLSTNQSLCGIQPMWCAPSVIAFQTSSRSLQVYATNNSSYSFDFQQVIKVGRDVDGLKIFLSNAVHIVSLVPEAMKHVFGLASADPGALLFEASQKLNQQEHTFYEFIKLIGGDEQMRQAVDKCLQTAAHDLRPAVQKDVLRAAKMGMMLCERYNTSPLVHTAQTLRVLNTLRQFGLPILFAELEELSIGSLINRLNALHHWPLAIQICNLMEIGVEEGVYKVLANWCLAIMTQCADKGGRGPDKEDEKLVADKIFARLESYPGVSYADIADVAAKHNLQGLAALLLDKETNLSRQVTVLLKLKQIDKALNKAVLSQQPDLMHLVLRHLRKNHTSQEVELLLRKSPQALSLYQSYIHEETPDKVLALYEQGDDFIRQSIYYLCKARDNSSTDPFFDPHSKLDLLKKTEEALKHMKDLSGAQLVASSAQLLQQNIKQEEKYSTYLVDKTLRETFLWAVGHADESILENLKKVHRISEKQSWMWTVEGLAMAARWEQLEKFGRSLKKSPVGYLPLIEACCRHGNLALAARFIDKVTSYEEQVKAFLLMGKVIEAASLAAKKSDLNSLQQIRRRLAHDSEDWRQVSNIINQIDRAY